ncbi:hypothetical protein PGN35_025295 [Nodosilinea sp. PGN35]|uniref:hypothetical protein n=1 Tax=Nodosilinea sp. PGN35 TaxID=3020489 RepID=UPI0023B32542|nr:hypothetical protein [Nodosilinea sp. TSF1-S3]MDF0367449.1 hypothetical protein [Nodosilinea sp. TSF1-S3]
MPELLIPIAAIALVTILAAGGLAVAGDRSKFPGRRQGGGSQSSAADIEQVDDAD